MLSNNPTASDEGSEQLFLVNLLNAIVPGGSEMEWVKQIVERNKISIDIIIDRDTFGNLSSFDVTYPKATELTKAKILKAYLENQSQYVENGVSYPVSEILELLEGYKQRPENFDRALDSAILQEKLAKRVSWLVHLNADTQPIFNTLFHYTLLLKIQRINECLAVEGNESQKVDGDLKSWINEEKQKLFNIAGIDYKSAPGYSFLTGNRSIKQLLQQEVARVVNLLKFAKDSIMGFSEDTGHYPNYSRSLLRGVLFVIQLGNIALLPNRLILTSIRESSYFLRLGVNRIFNWLMPNHPQSQAFVQAFTLGAQIALLFSGIRFFNLSWRMLFNLQFFPSSWSWGMIGNIMSGYAAFDFLAIVLRKGISWAHDLFIGAETTTQDHRPAPVEQDDVEAPPPSAEVEPSHEKVNTARANATPQQTPMADDLRTKLIQLLFEARQSSETDQTTNKKLNQETLRLMRKDEPYYLSNIDKAIIHQKGLDKVFGLAQQPPSDASPDRDDQNIGLSFG